jgi:ABC-type glutathione transport system ATPase component
VSGAQGNGQPILEVRDLRVSYGAIEALQGISLTLGAGEIVTLIGANGAGKSTTLRAIMGLVAPRRGEVRFRGQPTRSRPTFRLVREGLEQLAQIVLRSADRLGDGPGSGVDPLGKFGQQRQGLDRVNAGFGNHDHHLNI